RGAGRQEFGVGTPREEAANAASTLHTPTQIPTAGVRHLRQVVSVALLNHQVAIVNVKDDGISNPRAAAPGVFAADAAAHLAVIHKVAAPDVCHPNARQLVLVVVGEA